jgi:hypothetical protein
VQQIPESDWKIFRQLQPLALERFCQRVLDEVSQVAADTGKSSHERYLEVFRLLQKQDKELASCFDNPRRSDALFQLARIVFQGLLTDEEFARFSPETRAWVQRLRDLGRD